MRVRYLIALGLFMAGCTPQDPAEQAATDEEIMQRNEQLDQEQGQGQTNQGGRR